MLQEISQALCVSFEDVCRLQQDNLDLFYWFEKKLENVEKECEEKMESVQEENDRFEKHALDLETDVFRLEAQVEELEEEVKCLQELLEENGIDWTEAE